MKCPLEYGAECVCVCLRAHYNCRPAAGSIADSSLHFCSSVQAHPLGVRKRRWLWKAPCKIPSPFLVVGVKKSFTPLSSCSTMGCSTAQRRECVSTSFFPSVCPSRSCRRVALVCSTSLLPLLPPHQTTSSKLVEEGAKNLDSTLKERTRRRRRQKNLSA